MERKVILAIVLALALIAGYLYFFVISPSATKQLLPKPAAPKPGENLEPDHVEWVSNELGLYALHPSLSGEPAEIEMKVTDTGQTFSVIVQDGKPKATQGKASNPDISISADTKAFIRIFSARDFNTELLKLYDEKLVGIELLKGPETLILKGYKTIYDKFQKS